MMATCTLLKCLLVPAVTEFTPDTSYDGGRVPYRFYHNITLWSGSTVTDLYLRGPGQIIIRGNGVNVTNVITETPILVMGDDAIDLAFTNVSCASCDATVKVLGGTGSKHGAVPLGTLTLVDVSSNAFSVAIAHASGTVQCGGSTEGVLLQPIRATDMAVAAECGSIVDLADILQVYGRSYVLTFFDGPGHNVGHIVYTIKVLVVVLFVELTVLYLAAYHVMHEIHTNRHKKSE